MLLLIGAAIRLHRFPQVPVGLQQDETSEAYEAYSLLHTGKDRWGNRFPAYFLSWGSGQNVMQAYLTVPVVAVTGLTRASTRVVPLLCGLLTLPLMFSVTYLWYGEIAGLCALAMLTFAPWHIFISRIGIENTPLPFFLTLGVLTWTLALRSRSRVLIALSLLPFAAAAYTYGIAIPLLGSLLPLLAVMSVHAVRSRPRAWAASVLLLLIVTAPLGLFLLKNHVTKHEMAVERFLPFSVPLLTVTRFDQIQAETSTKLGKLRHNVALIRNGLASDIPFFQVPRRTPLPKIVCYAALIGCLVALWRSWRRRTLVDPFLAWLIACVPIALLVPLNTSRAIEFGIPMIALAASGIGFLLQLRPEFAYRAAIGTVCAMLFAIPAWRFLKAYNGPVYAGEVGPYTYPDLPAALDALAGLQRAGDLAYVSEGITLNYVQVLFLQRIDPVVFQRARPTVDDPDFGDWRFSRARLTLDGRPFVFLLAPLERGLCAEPTEMRTVGDFRLGRCDAKTAGVATAQPTAP